MIAPFCGVRTAAGVMLFASVTTTFPYRGKQNKTNKPTNNNNNKTQQQNTLNTFQNELIKSAIRSLF